MKARFMKYILMGMMGVICLTANAQQNDITFKTHVFTAKEAVDYAMQNAVQVKNALLDIKIQEQTNKGYTAEALPQINGTVNLSD